MRAPSLGPKQISKVREQLNKIIANEEDPVDRPLPRIGPGHAGYPGGIFSLLQDPGGSGPEKTRLLSISDNDDPTAMWSKTLLERLGIPQSAITPWNVFAGFGEERTAANLKRNLSLCQELLDTALPAAVVAQGNWAHKMAALLRFAGPIYCVPHPSRRGRIRKGAAEEIEAAFRAAMLSVHQNNLIRIRKDR